MKKKLISLLLSLVLIFSLSVPVTMATDETQQNTLYENLKATHHIADFMGEYQRAQTAQLNALTVAQLEDLIEHLAHIDTAGGASNLVDNRDAIVRELTTRLDALKAPLPTATPEPSADPGASPSASPEAGEPTPTPIPGTGATPAPIGGVSPSPEATTSPEPETAFDKIMAGTTPEEMYMAMLALMDEDMDGLMALTAEEIAAIAQRVNTLDPESADDNSVNLLDTLTYLPNYQPLDICPDCGQADGHSESCSVHTAAVDEETLKLAAIFVEKMAAVPSVADIQTFEDAVKAYEKVHAYMHVDAVMPANVQEAYDSAYQAFAALLGLADVSPSYPDETLKPHVQALLQDMISLYYTIEDAVAENPVVLYEAELFFGEEFAAAADKLMAILDEKPDWTPYTVMMMAAAPGGYPKVTSGVANDNIAINLFNYGTDINTKRANMGFLPFGHSSGYTGGMAGAAADFSVAFGGNPKKTRSTLVGGYPYVEEVSPTKDIAENLKPEKGSLAYLFDGTAATEKYAINTNRTGTTGLFTKQGDYYVYDSAVNAAFFNKTDGIFNLYENAVLRPYWTIDKEDDPATKDTNEYTRINNVQKGNFLPFNKIDATTADWEQTKDNADGVIKDYRLKSGLVDLWFGMTVEFDFYMPEDGQVGEQDMIFHFYGDDDVWVYIDDVLILDISGVHGSMTGNINFADGTVTNPTDCGGMGSDTRNLAQMLKDGGSTRGLDETKGTLQKYTKHTLKFFYMERGSNISYCQLKFNMDPVPTGNVTLEKQATGINPALSDNKSYKFTYTASNASADMQTVINNGVEYTVTGGVQGRSSGLLKPNDEFELRSGEKISFDVPDDSVVTLTEKADPKVTSATAWEKNGTVVDSTNNSVSFTVDLDTTTSYNYICKNERITNDLTVTKALVADANFEPGDSYEMNLAFGGTPYIGTATLTKADGTTKEVTFDAGKASITTGEMLTIADIPTSTAFTLSETTPTPQDATIYRYEAPQYAVNGGTASTTAVSTAVSADTTATTVTVTNTLKLLHGNLKITKTGIDGQDNHAEDATGKKETQSTIYTIQGTSRAGIPVDMKVTILGNSSVTVRDLPVGDYIVTEDPNWAWRYDADVYNAKATVKGGKTAEVSFANSRTANGLWLAGDSYRENWWGIFQTASNETN